MKIFKFGGASVKDASSVRNAARILEMYSGERLFVVVSAMGKTTNVLEQLVNLRYEKQDYAEHLAMLKKFQMNIAQELIPASATENPIVPAVETLFNALDRALQMSNYLPDFDALYDAIVPFGELLSTHIIYEY